MRLYALSFTTENFGNGIALVVASKHKEAFALLKRQGQLNATPEEYVLKASLDISDSNICSPTLIYEEYSGVRTVVGPPGTGIETINVDENGYLVVVLTDGTVQTSTNSLKGPKGDDATINGYNAINIEAGENVTINQGNNTLTINATNNGTWGSITGNIWNQSDLSTELNKAIVSVTTNEDGTIDFTKNNGDVTSVDLNHTHALADLIQDSTHRTVTDAEKEIWNVGGVKANTTAYWNASSYVPAKGEIIVYTDYDTVDGKNVPGIKIGGGNGYVQDLMFVADDVRDDLLAHIQDTDVHIQSGERTFWNNKLNVSESLIASQETIVFNRN